MVMNSPLDSEYFLEMVANKQHDNVPDIISYMLRVESDYRRKFVNRQTYLKAIAILLSRVVSIARFGKLSADGRLGDGKGTGSLAGNLERDHLDRIGSSGWVGGLPENIAIALLKRVCVVVSDAVIDRAEFLWEGMLREMSEMKQNEAPPAPPASVSMDGWATW